MASDKRKYVTFDQKSILLDFIKNHSKMIKPKFDRTFTIKDCNGLWEQLAGTLNALNGAKKSAREWRKCWHDLRRNTKEKVAKIKQRVKKGDYQDDLTPIQEKVIALIEGQEHKSDEEIFFDIKREDNNFFSDQELEYVTEVNKLALGTFNDEWDENLKQEEENIKAAEVAKTTSKFKTPQKSFIKSRRKRLKSFAERKLYIKKSYYDRKLSLLEQHIEAINRQTDAINKQTVVHERLMQLLSNNK